MPDARPYAVPMPSRISFSGWSRPEGEPLGEYVEGWDPHSDIELQQTVAADLVGIATDSGLSADTRFRVNVSCTSSDTGMSEALWNGPISSLQELRVSLPGSRIGGVVQIKTTITLGHANPDTRPGIATKAGSVVGEHIHSVRLAGNAPMFPVSVVDFAATSFGPYASWHLETSDDLEAQFLGTFLLLINERDTDLLKAIAASRPTAAQQVLVEWMEADIAEVMLETALRAVEVVELGDYPPDSVGEVLSRYVRMAELQGVGASILREDASTRRSRLLSVVRAAGLGRAFT